MISEILGERIVNIYSILSRVAFALILAVVAVSLNLGNATAASRIFKLHLKNGTKKSVYFKIVQQNGKRYCYEGSPGLGANLGPVRPDGHTTITIARIQGHGCDGQQGRFGIIPSGHSQVQLFNFSNGGGLALSNGPTKYIGKLSAKQRDESYTWFMLPAKANVPKTTFHRNNSRIFNLHLKNGTNRSVYFTVNRHSSRCYEGNVRLGSRLGPVAPGRQATIKIARVQGHGCNGKQGEFAITPSGQRQFQKFSFSNSGGLALGNVPNAYSGKLSGKSTYDESFTWTMGKKVANTGNPTIIRNASRIFKLHLKNGTRRSVYFTLSRRYSQCYEGNVRLGTRLGPVAPGRQATITLARIQGHGCNGKQGEFAVTPSGQSQFQKFTFNNGGNLSVANEPDAYDGVLGAKSSYDESYTWTMKPCPQGGCAFRKGQIASSNKNRIFKLHLKNNMARSIYFTVDRRFHSCYEGNLKPGASIGPVGPGRKTTIVLARIQGHGCDGKQGVFAIQPSGRSQIQKFSFSNEGQLAFTNEPNQYYSNLSPKSRYDASYTWAVKPCPATGCVLKAKAGGPRTSGDGRDYNRIFDFHLVNATTKPTTFTLSRKGQSCYEGNLPIGRSTPVIPPYAGFTIRLARIQGHGCDGKQGRFGIEVSGQREVQYLNFDNAGHLALTNYPDQYYGELSNKNTYDESYTWSLKPLDTSVKHSKTYRIRHAVSSKYLIQGYRGNRDDKRNVEVQPLAQADNNYRWILRPVGGGWFNFVNMKTGLVLTWDGDDLNVSNWGLASNPSPNKRGNRIFNLHVKNNTNVPITYYLSRQNSNCYEGTPKLGDWIGPIQPGGRSTIRLARIQGHGCDGKQGVFEIQPDKFSGVQKFSFSNNGGLDLVNEPSAYLSKLSNKSRRDESYTWTVNNCPSTGCVYEQYKDEKQLGSRSQQWKYVKQANNSYAIINRGNNRALEQAYHGRRGDKVNVTTDGGGTWFFESVGAADMARLTIESVKAIKASSGQDAGTQVLFAGIEAVAEIGIGVASGGLGTAALKTASSVGSKAAANALARKALKEVAEKIAKEATEAALKKAGKSVLWNSTKKFAKKKVSEKFTKKALLQDAAKKAAKARALAIANGQTAAPAAESLTELAFNKIYGESPDQLDIHVNGVSVWPNGGRDWRNIKSQQTRVVNTDFIFQRRRGLAMQLVEYDSGSGDDNLGWIFLDTEDLTVPLRFEEVLVVNKSEKSVYLVTFRVEPLETTAAQAAEAKAVRQRIAQNEKSQAPELKPETPNRGTGGGQQGGGQPGQYAQAQSCSVHGSVKSKNSGNRSTKLRFTNKGSENIKVYWINYQGKDSDYGNGAGPQINVAPGKTGKIDAYRGFVFVVKDAQNNCLGIAQTRGSRNGYAFGKVAQTTGGQTPPPPAAPDRSAGHDQNAQACSARGSMVSKNQGNRPAKLSISNTGATAIKVYWIDYQGKNSDYGNGNGPQISVAPGKTSKIDAYRGFVFAVHDDFNKCLGIAEIRESRNSYSFVGTNPASDDNNVVIRDSNDGSSTRAQIKADLNECGNNSDTTKRMAGCSRVIANPNATPVDRDSAYYNRGYVRCHVEPNNKDDAISDIYTAMQQSRASTQRFQKFLAGLKFYTGPVDGNQRNENYEAVKRYIDSGC